MTDLLNIVEVEFAGRTYEAALSTQDMIDLQYLCGYEGEFGTVPTPFSRIARNLISQPLDASVQEVTKTIELGLARCEMRRGDIKALIARMMHEGFASAASHAAVIAGSAFFGIKREDPLKDLDKPKKNTS